jgi:hypothetical protein
MSGFQIMEEHGDMNTNAKTWVETLRSGTYRQTSFALHRIDPIDGDSFCCLGVACQLALQAGVNLCPQKVYAPSLGWDVVQYAGKTRVLPAEVQEWVGLTSEDGECGEQEGYWSSLAELNDSGVGFQQIADAIEAHQDRLFG